MRIPASLTVLALALLALLASPRAASAQSQATTGVVEGTVSDAAGAVVRGAIVRVRNLDTSFTREVESDAEGRFRAALLPLGTYAVGVEKSGFARLVRTPVALSVGGTVTLRLELAAAGAGESVTVTAEAPLVETSRSEQSTLVGERSVANVPVNGRDFVSLVKLAPTVSVVQGPDGAEITINGQKGIQNNVSVDGADANNPFFGEQRGGQRPAFTIALEAVRELRVVTDGASAEFGRSSGGFVNVVTKSGTNELHGSAVLFFRDAALTSQNPDAVRAMLPTEDFRQWQFGASAGGPVRRDRAFFFVAYEQNRGRSAKPNRIDPRLVRIFAERFDDPDEQGLVERTNDANVLLAKLDWQVGPSSLVTLRHNFSRAEQANGTFDVPTWGRSANGRETDTSNAFIAQAVTALGQTAFNEFRFQYARERRPRFYDGPDLPDVAVAGVDPATGAETAYRFGRPFFLPAPTTDTRLQFTDNVSRVVGAHALKAGVDFNRTRSEQTFVGFARGRYIFASVDAFEAYLDDASDFGGLLFFQQFVPLGGRTVEEAGSQQFTQTEPELYAQDAWRATPRLTVSYGLRYYAQLEPQPILPLAERRYGQFVGAPGFPSDGTIPSFKRGWQPRLGLSWDPRGDARTVVRANAGIYYGRVSGLLVSAPRNADGALAGNVFTCCGSEFLPRPPANLGTLEDTAGFVPFNPGVRVFASDFENPRTWQWGASVERALAADIAASATFTYANAVHLARFVDRNAPTFVGHFAPDGRRIFDGPRPFALADGSGIGELVVAESSARSLYRALTFAIEKRYARGFELQANYTLSWDYSDDDNERDPFSYRYADVLDFRPEYGPSDRDQRHRFNAWAVVDLPLRFRLSLVYQARSARPDTLALATDANGDGHATDRPFANGADVGRNTVRRDDRYSSLDLRATRAFKLGERAELEAIVEGFNLFNSRNLVAVPRPLLFNFDGTVRSGFGDPRQAQLGLRLRF